MKHFVKTNDRFVRIDPIYETRPFFNQCRKLKLIIDKTPCGYSDFFKKLFAFERKRAYNYKTYKTRFCTTLKILIPQDIDTDNYKACVESLMNELLPKALPYVAFVLHEGKGTYFYIAISEREYFEKAQKIEFFSAHDIYKNPKTGRLCKATDEGAILVTKQGDVVKTMRSIFSKKVKYFKFATNTLFKEFIDNSKKTCIKIFKKFNAKDEECVIFKKFNYASLTNKESKKAKVYNKVIKKIEKEFDRFYCGLIVTKEISNKESRKKFMDLYRKYQKLIDNLGFTYSNKRYKIDFDISKKSLLSVLDLFVRKLNEDFQKLSYEIY